MRLENKDLFTENEVIEGVINYLKQKGKVENKVFQFADATKKEKGIDIRGKLGGNRYFIEAKGNVNKNNQYKSTWNTNFRWAISQIVLRIKTHSNNYADIYGIALPDIYVKKAIKMIEDNWLLKFGKLRLYGVYRNESNNLFAKEYKASDIYK